MFGSMRHHGIWNQIFVFFTIFFSLWVQAETIKIQIAMYNVPYHGSRSIGNLSTGSNQWTGVWNSQCKLEETSQTPLKVYISTMLNGLL